jgi:hypothetical protein
MKPTIIETPDRPMTLDDLRPVDVYADMDGTESFCFYDGVEHWCAAVGSQSAWTITPPYMPYITLVRPRTKWKRPANGATWDDPEDIPLGQHFVASNDPDTLHIKARKGAGYPIPDAPEYRAAILSEIVALNPVERR